MSELESWDLSGIPIEHLKEGEIILHNTEIKERIQALARVIADKYHGQNLHIIGLLKGAGPVTMDLIRALYEAGLDDATYDFMEVASYGEKKESSGTLNIIKDVAPDSVRGRQILLVDDVADTNRTLLGVNEHLLAMGVATIETFALLEKPAKRAVDFKPNYVGFRLPNVWVEGYGMDSPVEYMGRIQEHGRFNPNIVKGPTYPGLKR